jgi:hypothetical protein
MKTSSKRFTWAAGFLVLAMLTFTTYATFGSTMALALAAVFYAVFVIFAAWAWVSVKKEESRGR